MSRFIQRYLSCALALIPLGSAALALDVHITVSPTTNAGPAVMSLGLSDDVFNMIFASATDSARKRDMMAADLTGRGYLVSFFDPGSDPFYGLTIHDLPPGQTVSMDTGATGSSQEQLAAAGVRSAAGAFTGHFQPLDSAGQPAIFTAGIVTDVGELTARTSAEELSFQTDGPIICQALFQRLAPRAPQYGAQINYAGDRLEVYFDPAYTVTQGGIIFGTTSPSSGCRGQLDPVSTRPCPADYTGDGQVDFGDYLQFLNFYDAQDPRADLNGDGEVDFTDYLMFLNLYEAGC